MGEKDREPHRIEGEASSRTVQLYTEEGLHKDNVDYTFLVAYIAPYGSNSRHDHTVDELMYVATGHGWAPVGNDEGPLDVGSLIQAPALMMHQIFNDSPETMKLVCTFVPQAPKRRVGCAPGQGQRINRLALEGLPVDEDMTPCSSSRREYCTI